MFSAAPFHRRKIIDDVSYISIYISAKFSLKDLVPEENSLERQIEPLKSLAEVKLIQDWCHPNVLQKKEGNSKKLQ